MSDLPVFLCYRQVDGVEVAEWVYGLLNRAEAPAFAEAKDPVRLDVYFDRATPAVPDWHQVHRPALQRARAIVVICTPGLLPKLSDDDWVHMELDWWLEHRKAAPILIDTSGEGERWIPEKVRKRWPNAQRVLVDLPGWRSLSSEERRGKEELTRERILGGVRYSEEHVRYEDLDRQRRMVAKLKRALATAAVTIVVALLLGGLAGLQWRRAEFQRRQLEIQQQIALVSKLAAQAELTITMEANDVQRGTLLALEAFRRSDTSRTLLSVEVDQTMRRASDLIPPHVRHIFHDQTPSATAFSSNGQFLAASWFGAVRMWDTGGYGQSMHIPLGYRSADVLAFDQDDRYLVAIERDVLEGALIVFAWEVPSGRLISQSEHHEEAAFALSSDAVHLALSDDGTNVDVFELPEMRKVASLVSQQSGVRKVAFDRQNRYVGVLIAENGAVDIWNWASQRIVRTIQRADSTEMIRDFTFVENEGLLATLSSGGRVVLWDIAAGIEGARTGRDVGLALADSRHGGSIAVMHDVTSVAILQLPSLTVTGHIRQTGEISGRYGLIFSPDGSMLVTSGSGYGGNRTARVWDLSNNVEVARITHGLEGGVSSVSFTADGRHVATSSWDGVRVWDVGSHRNRERLVHGARVWVSDFSPNGQYLATGSDDNTARVWDIDTGREVRRISHDQGVMRVAFDHSGAYVATGSYDGVVQVASVATETETLKLRHDDHVYGLAWMPNDEQIVTAAGTSARIWDVNSGSVTHTMDHEERLEGDCLLVSPEGDYIVTANWEDVYVWDASTGRQVERLPHGGTADIHAFSHDGEYFISSELGRMHVWEVGTWKRYASVPLGTDGVQAASFSPDGSAIASAHLSGAVAITAFETGEIVHVLSHERPVQDVVFSEDGRFIATVGWDRMARLWEADTYSEVLRLSHEHDLWGVSISPDGKYLATNGMSNVARVWLLRRQDLYMDVCSRLTRNLSFDEWRAYIGDEPYSATCSAIPLDPVEVGKEADALLDAGESVSARRRFEEAAQMAIEMQRAYAANTICWAGSTRDLSESVMPACTFAVEADPENASHRDSRGLARAMLGDKEGAIEDFEFYVEHGAEAYIPTRRSWIEDLAKGENPFDERTLEELRSHR